MMHIIIPSNIIKFILTQNNFVFNGHYFLDIRGTAMGNNMASIYANLFMDALEEDMLTPATAYLLP